MNNNDTPAILAPTLLMSEQQIREMAERPPVSEADLARKLGINRNCFTQWRKSGALKYPAHFTTQGRGAIVLTPEGQARVAELLSLPDPSSLIDHPLTPALVAVRVTGNGTNPRLLRGRIAGTGETCTMRLVTGNVFNHHFQSGATLQVPDCKVEGCYEFTGKPPRRVRL